MRRPVVRKAGDKLVGPYRLLAKIGEGTIGRVYRAEHTAIGKQVAVKVLRKRYRKHGHVMQRFFAEAKAMSRIGNDHVVEVTDFVETLDGKACYVMEHLVGQSLAELIDEGPISLYRAINIARQLAAGIAAVHAEGVVHRDIKPGNVFITSKDDEPDFVKILDFGVAKLESHDDDDSLRHRTSLGELLGTPEYMSPEQSFGMDVDASSDVYAFGVTLYELFSGKRPFSGTMDEVLEAQRNEEAVRLDRLSIGVPTPVADLVARCMSKSIARRPAMRAVVRQLDEMTVELPPAHRRPNMIAAATLAIGVSVMALAAFVKLRPAEPVQIPAVISQKHRSLEPVHTSAARSQVPDAPALEERSPESSADVAAAKPVPAKRARADRSPASEGAAPKARARARGRVRKAAPNKPKRVDPAEIKDPFGDF